MMRDVGNATSADDVRHRDPWTVPPLGSVPVRCGHSWGIARHRLLRGEPPPVRGGERGLAPCCGAVGYLRMRMISRMTGTITRSSPITAAALMRWVYADVACSAAPLPTRASGVLLSGSQTQMLFHWP